MLQKENDVLLAGPSVTKSDVTGPPKTTEETGTVDRASSSSWQPLIYNVRI
jgi:hypothetical protein